MNQNAFLSLQDELAFQRLGPDYYDEVEAADFPTHVLRFRNDDILRLLKLTPDQVDDEDFLQAFGQFKKPRSHRFLAMRYHGYQFGEYNSELGDGRGFLYGQYRGTDGQLYDLGTKGSGTTAYSRGGDGRLTLKGGVREVLASEALHALGVRTSRCLSLVETGESLWRGDEPSPARSSVLVRANRSHIRFGSFERLLYLKRRDLVQKLLNHVIDTYYPECSQDSQAQVETHVRFYASLVKRMAELAAQWMSVGFCHGVLNTDNMLITGDGFDYGPYAFIRNYDPKFTAAYFDYWGYYRFGNQPEICRLNLERLQAPLELVIPKQELDSCLTKFGSYYKAAYTQRMLNKLGLDTLASDQADELMNATLRFLSSTQMSYHSFFARLTRLFSPKWQEGLDLVFKGAFVLRNPDEQELLKQWSIKYHQALQSIQDIEKVSQRLRQHNPPTVLLKPEIEAVWDPIVNEDDWSPFYNLLHRLRDFQWDPV